MALGEDLLLLAIPRRGGRVRAADRIGFALRASVLVDLALLGRVVIAGRRIKIIDSAPTDDRRLDNALKALGGVEVPTLESWLRGTPRGYGMITMYLSRLADEGAVRFAVRRERIATPPRAQLLDYDRRAAVLARLDQVVRGRQGDDAARALGGLVHACGLDRVLYRGPFGVRARRRLARLADQREITASTAAARVAGDAALADAIAQAISEGLARMTGELVKLMRYEYGLEHTTGWQHHDVTSGHHHGGYDSGGGGAHHHHST